MLTTNVLLIFMSSVGVLHGIFIAVYLCGFTKVQTTSNRILSILLVVLSFRIGKSVILEFARDIEYLLIFTGLASLMLIGPLFYMYCRAVINPLWRISRTYMLHFIPFLPALAFAIIAPEMIRQTPTFVFIGLFCLYYGHYLFYLFLSVRLIHRTRMENGNSPSLKWLQLLSYGLAAIWVVYVLNLIDEQIPYIIGPVLYSLIAYLITFIAIKKEYLVQAAATKYKTTSISKTEADQLFENIKTLVAEEHLYKDPGLSLNTLSKRLRVSPQKVSMAINSNGDSNFNGFINSFRVEHAKKLLRDKKYHKFTIAFISNEIGFSSLSTFNSAFKKQTGLTPSQYRQQEEVAAADL